ncbi:MAG: hypothetical protein E7Y34_01850, partial [Mycoplasma sp.]|nr:hypothetical protein [Mycoplasma sp.]
MSLKNKNKMMLIDGNSLFYRAYYATQYKNDKLWTNSEGVPVNAVLVFWKMLHNLVLTYKPTHLMIALDAHGVSFRKKQFPFYKANRKENPKDLIAQFSIFREMLDSTGIEWLENVDLEADDLIASFVNQNKDLANQILIVSSDQDLMQLVEDKVSILIPKTKQEYLLVNNSNFFSLNNIYPKQIVDYKSLLGDPSDNIPGA